MDASSAAATVGAESTSGATSNDNQHGSPSNRNSSGPSSMSTPKVGDRISKNGLQNTSPLPSNSVDPLDEDQVFGDGPGLVNLEQIRNPHFISITSNRNTLLPWGAHNRSSIAACNLTGAIDFAPGDGNLRPGEVVMRALFADFTLQSEKKIETVMLECKDKSLAKVLQRGENTQFDQLLTSFGTVAEHCLPSILTTLLAWHKRQLSDVEIKHDLKRIEKIAKTNPELEYQLQRREPAVEFIFCLMLIEVLKQLHFHPGHDGIIKEIENLAFKHFKYRDKFVKLSLFFM